MSEQIKKAIARIRDFGLHHAIKDLPHSTYTVEAFELAIKCMQSELERLENKPLSLKELKGMIGESVWHCLDGYLLVRDIDEKRGVLCINSMGGKYRYDFIHNFYKHKPKGK